MANIVVLGAGAMGTAITVPISDNGHQVRLVGTHLDTDIIESLHQDRRHPKLSALIPESVLPLTINQLDEALSGADLLILGVNSLGIDWAGNILANRLIGGFPVTAVTKGLNGQGGQLLILPEVFKQHLPVDARKRVQICAIGGPSIAGELASRHHTSIVLAGQDDSTLEKIADILRTPYYHVWTTTDLIGVEVCAALKNLYALGVGLVYGSLDQHPTEKRRDNLHNFASSLFAQAVYEMGYMVEMMGGNPVTAFTLPGAGDLFTTCQGGRNFRFGRLLGSGLDFKSARSNFSANETIEAIELAFSIRPALDNMIQIGSLNGKRLILLQKLVSIVCSGAPIEFDWKNFFLDALS